MTKLSSTLPGGDNNGLGALARALTTDPHKTALIVAVVDCKSITVDTDTGDKVATVRIRRVEPIDPQDTEQAQRLLVRGLERRTGAVMLPIDLEDELSALFANLVDGVDMETGEILDDNTEDDNGDTEAEAQPAESDPQESAEAVDGPTPALDPWDDPKQGIPTVDVDATPGGLDMALLESMLTEPAPDLTPADVPEPSGLLDVDDVCKAFDVTPADIGLTGPEPAPEKPKRVRKSRAKPKPEPEPDDSPRWPEP